MNDIGILLAGLLVTAAMVAGCDRTLKEDLPDSRPAMDGPVIVNASEAAVQGEIILKLRPAATKAGLSGAPAASLEVDRILREVGQVGFERLFPDGGRFGRRTHEAGLDRWFIARYDPDIPVARVAEMLSGCSDIEVIEYSRLTRPAGDTRSQPSIGLQSIQDDARNEPFPFNESLRMRTMQWHYNNTGSIYSRKTVVGADADVYKAWQLCTGHPDVIVAVIDQGVMYTHEDLADNMWTNAGEIPGNGIDDDGNGYIDDVHGFNFTDNVGDLSFDAENTHGTHVAGIIAAVNNNGIGVNGIAGGDGSGNGVRIMSLETLGSSESGTSGGGLSAQVRAIKYAADNGAVICQNSWGYTAGGISRIDWNKGVYSSLSEAVSYFIRYAGMDEDGQQEGPMAGGIVIFSAGNDASFELSYPASDPQVVSVAATSFNGAPAYYTNYGSWVSICAPGGDLMTDSSYGGVYSTIVGDDGGSSYGTMQGTSMACPHVSGACALAVSYFYGESKRKGLTSEMLRQALLSSTGSVDRYCPAGYAGKMGAGSLDTYKLLRTILKLEDIPPLRIGIGTTTQLSLSAFFLDTDVLTYRVDAPSIVDLSLSDGVLTIRGAGKGTTTITVTDGRAIVKPFEVTVG